MAGMDRILRSRWGWTVWWIALTPLVLVIWNAVSGASGPDPAKALVDGTGIWAVRFLLASLAMTPLRLLTGLSGWVRYRRPLGLMAALYASVHLLAYVVFLLEGELGRLATELVKRPYIVVGFAAWLALMPSPLPAPDTGSADWGADGCRYTKPFMASSCWPCSISCGWKKQA